MNIYIKNFEVIKLNHILQTFINHKNLKEPKLEADPPPCNDLKKIKLRSSELDSSVSRFKKIKE